MTMPQHLQRCAASWQHASLREGGELQYFPFKERDGTAQASDDAKQILEFFRKPATDGDDDAATGQVHGGNLSRKLTIDQPKYFSLLCRNAPHDASSIKFPRPHSLQRSAPSINQQAPCLRFKPLYCGPKKFHEGQNILNLSPIPHSRNSSGMEC